jgi:hypothetical protein
LIGSPEQPLSHLIDDNGKGFNPSKVIIRGYGNKYRNVTSLKTNEPEHIGILFCDYNGTTNIPRMEISISDSQDIDAPTAKIVFTNIALTFVSMSQIPSECD